MKVRFYCDVPEFRTPNHSLTATTIPSVCAFPQHKRITFEVNLPAGMYRESDYLVIQPIVAEVVDE